MNFIIKIVLTKLILSNFFFFNILSMNFKMSKVEVQKVPKIGKLHPKNYFFFS